MSGFSKLFSGLFSNSFPHCAGKNSGGGGVVVPDTTPPAVPTVLVATPASGQLTLTWVDPTAADLASVKVFRSSTFTGGYLLLATVPAGTESLVDTGLTNGTTYYYELSAVDLTGNESAKTSAVGGTPGAANLFTDPTLTGDFTGTSGTSSVSHATETIAGLGSVNVAVWTEGSGNEIILPVNFRTFSVTPGKTLNISWYMWSDTANFMKNPFSVVVGGTTYYLTSSYAWTTTSVEVVWPYDGSSTWKQFAFTTDPVPSGSSAEFSYSQPYRATHPFSAKVTEFSVTEGQTVAPISVVSSTFTADNSTLFSKPEVGLWTTSARSKPTPPSPWPSSPPMTLQYWNLQLDAYVSSSTLPTSFLDSTGTTLAQFRGSDVKVIIRPRYNNPSANGTTTYAEYSDMLTHIQQLGALFTTYSDVIAFVQAGFVGLWGEFHGGGTVTTNTDLELAKDSNGVPYRNGIKDALIQYMPSNRFVAVRRPNFIGPSDLASSYDFGWYTTLVGLANRFNGSEQSRIALYNDHFMSDSAFGYPIDVYDGTTPTRDREIVSAYGPISPMGGETDGGITRYNTGAKVLAEMQLASWDYLHADYSQTVISNWTSAQRNEMLLKLGYRYQLTSASVSSPVQAGASMSVTLNIDNAGFGKLYNARPLNIVFVGSGGPFTVEALTDCRRSMPLGGKSATLNLSFNAPAGLVSGQSYALHLQMPDASSHLSSRVGSMIRFANAGVWDSSTGYNNLGLTVAVGAAGVDTSPPGLPTSVTVATTSTSVTLSWVDPTAADLASIKVYGSASASSGFSLLSTVSAGVQTYTESGLTAGTAYYYELSSVDTTGNESAKSSVYSGTPTATYTNLFTGSDFSGDAVVTSGSSVVSHVTTTDFTALGSINAVQLVESSSTEVAPMTDYREITVTPGTQYSISFYMEADSANCLKTPIRVTVDTTTYYLQSDGSTWSTTSWEWVAPYAGGNAKTRVSTVVDAIPAGTTATLKMHRVYRAVSGPFTALLTAEQVTAGSTLRAYVAG